MNLTAPLSITGYVDIARHQSWLSQCDGKLRQVATRLLLRVIHGAEDDTEV